MSALRGSAGLTNSAPARLAAADAGAGVRPMPASDPEQVFFHFDFLRSLQLHKKLAAGIFAFALLACAAYVAKGWNNYTAQALVYVQPAPPRLLSNGPENRWPYDSNTYDSYIQQQLHNVTRADVLAAAVAQIPGWQRSGENIQLAAARLGRALEVVRVGSGYQISITAKAKDPEKAARIANAVAASYIESSTRELRAGDDQRIELLREERDRVQKELAGDRTEQDDLNKKLGVASLGSSPVDPIDEQINAVRAELIKARADNDEAAARVMTAGKTGTASTAALDAEADDLVATDPGMVSMKTSLNARRSQLITQMANLTANNPQYKQDAEELAQINSSLESMTKDLRAKAAAHIQQKLKNDLDRTSDVEGKLNAQLAQLTASAGTAGPRLQRLNELAADMQRLQSRFALIDEQFRNLLLENNAPGAVYLSSAAAPPLAASREVLLRNAIVILLAGLLLGWGAALLAHNLDQRIYIAADVERVLGFSPMAQLPDFHEVGPGVEEEYLLRLAAALEHAYQQGELKSCIFTGVASGSGTTTVSTRITGMLEAMGRSTVLVNASGSPAPPPPAEDAFDAETGLVHAPRSTRSTALLQQMAEETGEDTIVLSDTAPLLVSGETEYLARFVDSAIVVIQSGVTTRAQLRDVAHTLQRLDVSAVGFVLNRISKEKANPSFRDSVRAVEQRVYGAARPQNAGEKKPKARTKKKNVANDEQDPDPGNTGGRPAASNRVVAPEPESETMVREQEAPMRAAAVPAETRPVENVPFSIVGAPVTAVDAPAAAPVEQFEAAGEASNAELPARGRPLRRSAPKPQPAPTPEAAPAPTPAPVAARPQAPAAPPAQTPEAAAAPVFAQAPARPAPAPVRPVPNSSPVSAAEAAPQAAARVAPPPAVPAAAPSFSPAAMAGVNAPPMHDVALQTRSSAPEGDLREIPYSAARLGGLRSLLVSLGLRSANSKDDEFHEAAEASQEPRHERVAERPAERTVYSEPLAPLAPAGDAEVVGFDPALVTATPEFLPPRPVVEVTEKEPEKEPRAPAAPRKNRWDSTDELDTLPSRRGQYRKRR